LKRLIYSLLALSILMFACKTVNTTGTPPVIITQQSVPPAETPVQALQPTGSPVATVSFDASKVGTIERDVTYCTMEGTALKMDIYYLSSAAKPWPAVVYVHGGAWIQGSKTEGAGFDDQTALTSAGFLYVAIDYRLAPQARFPAMIEDVKCAVRYLRANASRYNLDPDHIGALGGSAGGHLVSLLGLTDASAGWEVGEYLDQSSRVQAVVDYFGPSDLTHGDQPDGGTKPMALVVFGTNDPNSPLLVAASPVTYITRDDPPFLIFHGDQDTTVPLAQSQTLYDRLRAAGIDATFVIVKNAGHGFAPSGGAIQPTRAQITQRVVDFFNQKLK
jgi:acetyl esterase/lipase